MQKEYKVKRSCGHKEKLIILEETARGDKQAAMKQECWSCYEKKTQGETQQT